MARGVCTAIHKVFPILNYTSMMRYSAPFIGLAEKAFPLVSWFDRLTFALLWLLFNLLSRSRVAMWTLSRLVDACIAVSVFYYSNVRNYLAAKYDDATLRYEDENLEHLQISCYRSAFEMQL